MSKKNIPLSQASIGKEEEKAVLETLHSGWLTHGDKNKEFEKNFAEYVGVKHAISMNSCTSALFIALKANNITGEVILPSFTFSASANAVVTAGAIPVFADINYETGNLDTKSVEGVISNKTEAIMVVHFGGQAANIGELKNITEKHNLLLIEDSAEAIGAEYDGYKTGSFGVGCFSFFPTKNITTGEGGMFTTNDDNLAEKAHLLIAHGIPKAQNPPHPGYRSATLPGYNFRMSNLLAAVGVEQMKKIDTFNQKRRHTANLYNELLEPIKEVETPTEKTDNLHVYQMYTIKTNTNIRNELLAHLKENGIGASIHFSPPVHLQEYYKKQNFKSTTLTNTEKLANEIITLPMFPDMSEEDVRYICTKIKNFFE